MHFLAGDQNSARNFYFRPYYGPLCFPSKFKKWPNLRDFWLWIRLESRNFGRLVKKFFRPKKYAFSGRRSKIGQKFLFPAEFWPFAKFSNMLFLGDFSKFLTLDVARGQKFRAFCQKFFSAKKICIFWPETKNRPEISISGHIMAIFAISQKGKNHHFLAKFRLSKWLEGRNFGRFVKFFFRPKKYAFSGRRLKIG